MHRFSAIAVIFSSNIAETVVQFVVKIYFAFRH